MTDIHKPRPLTLGEQRHRAAALFAETRSYAEIGAVMGVTPIKARDLCMQFDKLSKLQGTRALRFELSQRAILCLLTGRNAQRMGSSVQERMERLLQIAASYSRRQLLDEEGVGVKTVDEIGVWLTSKGLSFRAPNVSAAKAAAIADAHRVMVASPPLSPHAIMPSVVTVMPQGL